MILHGLSQLKYHTGSDDCIKNAYAVLTVGDVDRVEKWCAVID